MDKENTSLSVCETQDRGGTIYTIVFPILQVRNSSYINNLSGICSLYCWDFGCLMFSCTY